MTGQGGEGQREQAMGWMVRPSLSQPTEEKWVGGFSMALSPYSSPGCLSSVLLLEVPFLGCTGELRWVETHRSVASRGLVGR